MKVSVTVDKAAMQRIKGILGELGDDVLLKSMTKTQRRKMKRIVASAKAKAPVRTGATREAIAMKVVTKKKTGRMYAGVGLDRNVVLYDLKTKKRIVPANYGHLPELGFTHAKTGEQVPAQPYMRPAINSEAGPDLGLNDMVVNLEKDVARMAKKKGGGR